MWIVQFQYLESTITVLKPFEETSSDLIDFQYMYKKHWDINDDMKVSKFWPNFHFHIYIYAFSRHVSKATYNKET